MAVTMNSFWDNAGTIIPGGDAEYVVAEQPIAEYDNWFNYNIVADIQAVIDDVINKFNANTILKADTDNTPAALVVAEQTIVGRKTGNSIAALIDSEVLAIIGVEPGATADQTNTEIRDAVEAAADSNTFTDNDHTKLNGIEPAADVTDATNVAAAGATMESLFDANTILKADGDDTPAALTVAEQTLVGRITAGVITALTASQVRTLISVADGADVTGDNAPKSHASTHETGGSDVMDVRVSYQVSDDIIHSNDSQKAGVAGSPAIEKRITLAFPPGTYRVQFKLNGSNNESHAYLRDDGIQIGTQRIGTGVLDTWTEDVSVTSGELELYVSVNAGFAGTVEDFRILGLLGQPGFTNNDP